MFLQLFHYLLIWNDSVNIFIGYRDMVQNQSRWRRLSSYIFRNSTIYILDPLWPLCGLYVFAHQIWCKSVRDTHFYVFQDGSRCHLEFPKKCYFGPRFDPSISHIYLSTKFGRNRSRIGQDIPFNDYFEMADATILNCTTKSQHIWQQHNVAPQLINIITATYSMFDRVTAIWRQLTTDLP